MLSAEQTLWTEIATLSYVWILLPSYSDEEANTPKPTGLAHMNDQVISAGLPNGEWTPPVVSGVRDQDVVMDER